MLKMKECVPFEATLQTVLRSQEELPEFHTLLAQLRDLGFAGVELNLPDLEVIAPETLAGLLNEYGLRLTYLATGAYAKVRGLSLSSGDEQVRKAAVEGCIANLEYAGRAGVGVILGFFKGGPMEEETAAKAVLIRSLREICAGTQAPGPILLEATNRKETAVVRTLREAEEVLTAVGDPRLRILPDTYHMNIEETNSMAEVERLLPHICNLHLSDDNRYLPGLGSLEFGTILRQLCDMGYKGTVGLEGNVKQTLAADLTESAQALCSAAKESLF